MTSNKIRLTHQKWKQIIQFVVKIWTGLVQKIVSKKPYPLWQESRFVTPPVSLINRNATCRFNQDLRSKHTLPFRLPHKLCGTHHKNIIFPLIHGVNSCVIIAHSYTLIVESYLRPLENKFGHLIAWQQMRSALTT